MLVEATLYGLAGIVAVVLVRRFVIKLVTKSSLAPPVPRLLPVHNLMDSVYCKHEITRGNSRDRVACLHWLVVPYQRIDHRAGPGCFADNFEGTVCVYCGSIIEEKQTL